MLPCQSAHGPKWSLSYRPSLYLDGFVNPEHLLHAFRHATRLAYADSRFSLSEVILHTRYYAGMQQMVAPDDVENTMAHSAALDRVLPPMQDRDVFDATRAKLVFEHRCVLATGIDRA